MAAKADVHCIPLLRKIQAVSIQDTKLSPTLLIMVFPKTIATWYVTKPQTRYQFIQNPKP